MKWMGGVLPTFCQKFMRTILMRGFNMRFEQKLTAGHGFFLSKPRAYRPIPLNRGVKRIFLQE
jgi:hypothetical protein